MARTKKWGRISFQAQQASRRFPETPVLTEMTTWQQDDTGKFENDAMDIEDNDEEDGGVPLDERGSSPTHVSMDPSTDMEMMAQYVQKPVMSLNQATDLWQLPMTPLSMKPKGLRLVGIRKGFEYVYHHSCRLIKRNWGCGAGDCLPVELRKCTPYSLALLRRLRMLSSHSKQNHTLIMSLMLDVCQQRVTEAAGASVEQPQTQFVETFVDPSLGCEVTVQENFYGLMIRDVSKVAEEFKKYGKKASKKMQKAHDLKAAGLNKSQIAKSGIADRVVKRRREEAALRTSRRLEEIQSRFKSPYALLAAESQDDATVPPNSPVHTSNDFPTFPMAGNLTIRTKTVPATQQTEAKPLPPGQNQLGYIQATQMARVAGAPADSSHQDKENAMQMARLMKQMGVDRSVPSGRRRLKKLGGGGLSRGNASGALPTERINLSKISALPALGPVTNNEDLARIGQRPLPD